jgi:hypothetical protein
MPIKGQTDNEFYQIEQCVSLNCANWLHKIRGFDKCMNCDEIAGDM